MAAQTRGPWSGCKTDSLANYNCAQYYNGSVTLSGELKGPGVHQTLSIVASVTGGKVSCHVKSSEAGEYDAPGMLAVEHETTASAGGYEISVWCPDAEGGAPTRDDDPLIRVMDQKAADYGILEGKDSYDHPDADPANGLSGTQTVTWRLKRP